MQRAKFSVYWGVQSPEPLSSAHKTIKKLENMLGSRLAMFAAYGELLTICVARTMQTWPLVSHSGMN